MGNAWKGFRDQVPGIRGQGAGSRVRIKEKNRTKGQESRIKKKGTRFKEQGKNKLKTFYDFCFKPSIFGN